MLSIPIKTQHTKFESTLKSLIQAFDTNDQIVMGDILEYSRKKEEAEIKCSKLLNDYEVKMM